MPNSPKKIWSRYDSTLKYVQWKSQEHYERRKEEKMAIFSNSQIDLHYNKNVQDEISVTASPGLIHCVDIQYGRP